MRTGPPHAACLIALAALAAAGLTAEADAQAAPEIRTIGLLVPETGAAEVLGVEVNETISFALSEFNRHLLDSGAGWQMSIEKRDTKSDPAESRRLIEELDKMGIKAVVGPATSSSVREIKGYVDDNEMVVISYSSGASDLSIPGDRIFRTISDTESHSVANYRLMHDDGVKEVVTIFLDDSIGRSVNRTMYEVINADPSDGIVMRGSISFPTGGAHAPAVTEELRAVLSAHPPIADYGKVGIVIFDYSDKLVDIVQDIAGASIPGMNETRWYGPDHRMKDLAANRITSSFLAETSYKAFVMAYSENALNMRIDSQVSEASVYAYTTFDALFMMGNAINMAGTATDADAIAAAIPVAARAGHGPELYEPAVDPPVRGPDGLYEYSSALGTSAELNEAGDRAAADHHIYSIVDGAFKATHRYDPSADAILEYSVPEKRAVGAITSETGPLSVDIGIAAGETASLAAYNYNLELAGKGADWRLEIVKRDDGTYPPRSLEIAEAFHGDGIRAMVGPLSSGSVASVLDFVNGNDMVAVSYASSSPVLALPDGVFRMQVDDSHSARVYAELLDRDGITDLVIVYRDDPWGRSLNDYIAEYAGRHGIAVLPGVAYAPAAPSDPAPDYREVVDALKSRLEGVDRSGAAVMLFGFAEIWDIIDLARVDRDLQEGRWYSYLSSLYPNLPQERIQWMERVKYTGAIVHNAESDISRHIDANVPDANSYSYRMYDALYALAGAINATGTSEDADALRTAIPKAASALWPTALGFQIVLNEAGDIAEAGLWRVRDEKRRIEAEGRFTTMTRARLSR